MSSGNQPSVVRMFEAMADRVRAGEPWTHVLRDYGLMIAPDTAFADAPQCCKDALATSTLVRWPDIVSWSHHD